MPILLLFIVGIMLLAADVFVSSFVMAAFGGVAMLAGCVVAYRDYGVLAAGLAGISAVALLGGAVYVELVLLPKTRLGRGLVVRIDLRSSSQPPVAPARRWSGAPRPLTPRLPRADTCSSRAPLRGLLPQRPRGPGEVLRVIGMDNFD